MSALTKAIISYIDSATTPTLSDFVLENEDLIKQNYYQNSEWASIVVKEYQRLIQEKGIKFRKGHWASTVNKVDTRMRKMEGNTTSNILSSKEPTLITETTKGIVTEKYDKMSNKLKLPSNKYLEDVMKTYSATCSYYHPTHFFVFDADDLIYKTLLTEEDINFIKNLNPITLSKVNNEFEKECKKFKGKKTAIDIIKSCDVAKFDGSTQGYDVYWLNKSMANAMDGFLFVDINDPPSQSEGDLQHNTWSFMKTCFRSIGVSCHSGEVYSSCVAAVESSKRQLDGKSRISKKASKNKPDLLYVKNNVEYAVGEFALTLDSEATKVVRERGFKAPVMLKVMLDKIVKDYPKVQGSITLVGFVINGLHLETIAIKMLNNIACVSSVGNFDFPTNIQSFVGPATKVLKHFVQIKELLKETIEKIEDNDDDE